MSDQATNPSVDDNKSPGPARARFGWLILLIVAIVVIDQAIKLYVKTHFYLGEDVEVFPFFHLKFIENPGMAMGMNFIPKIVLTLGRIAAVTLLIWVISKLVRLKDISKGFLVVLAMITAGAAGNIFDCVFYGEIFNNPLPPEVATMFPIDGGYAQWFHGRVVDMFYFPLFEFVWPAWIPVIGDNYFEFFSYIFNFADASICTGVILLLLFYRRDADKAFSHFFPKQK